MTRGNPETSPVPYEQTGRRSQKSRTRQALVAATRELLGRGVTPTVEQAAAEADISRTTAYRYFPNQTALVVAAHPQIEQRTLLPADAPTDPEARLNMVLTEHARIILDWEPQLRAQWRISLDPAMQAPGPILRQGRAIGWIEDALAPLRESHPHIDTRQLAIAIRSATGIEAFVWLVDIAGLTRQQAATQLCWTGGTLLRAALTPGAPAIPRK